MWQNKQTKTVMKKWVIVETSSWFIFEDYFQNKEKLRINGRNINLVFNGINSYEQLEYLKCYLKRKNIFQDEEVIQINSAISKYATNKFSQMIVI